MGVFKNRKKEEKKEYFDVRDLLEQILRNNGHWLSSEKAFGW